MTKQAKLTADQTQALADILDGAPSWLRSHEAGNLIAAGMLDGNCKLTEAGRKIAAAALRVIDARRAAVKS